MPNGDDGPDDGFGRDNGSGRNDGSGRDDGSTRRSWLEHMLRPLSFVGAIRERRQIRRFCDESLTLYRQIEIHMPQAASTERYARFIELRSGAVSAAAQTVMRRAGESFADWPTERPLRFQDVVQYLAVTDCLKIDIAVTDVRSRRVDFVIGIVAEVIPRSL